MVLQEAEESHGPEWSQYLNMITVIKCGHFSEIKKKKKVKVNELGVLSAVPDMFRYINTNTTLLVQHNWGVKKKKNLK